MTRTRNYNSGRYAFRQSAAMICLFVVIAANSTLACGPPHDWFENKAKREGIQRVTRYHQLVGSATQWQYYRPYIRGKLLTTDRRYHEAAEFYRTWARSLRRQGRGRILTGVAHWALRSADLRLLVLQMTRDDPENAAAALQVCDLIDAGRQQEGGQAAQPVKGLIGKYLRGITSNGKGTQAMERLMLQADRSEPLSPYLAYRRIRYGADHETIIAKADKFLRQFPNHHLADDILGWSARSCIKLGRRQQAVSRYLDILQNYADGDIVAPAITSLRQIISADDIFEFKTPSKTRLSHLVRELCLFKPKQKSAATWMAHAKTCRNNPAYRVLEPYFLAATVEAGAVVERSDWGWQGGRPWSSELDRNASNALHKLVESYPYHHKAPRLVWHYATVNDFSPEQLLKILKCSDEPFVTDRLLDLFGDRITLAAANALNQTKTTAGNANFVTDLPLGPELFEYLSDANILAGTPKNRFSPKHNEQLISAACRLLPQLESIPMTEDEYRLYYLLHLRVCLAPEHIEEYTEVRTKGQHLKFNEFEKKELALLDAVYAFRGPKKNPHSLLNIAARAKHPYRYTAGKVLAWDAREAENWPLLLRSAALGDVYDAFATAFNRCSPEALEAAYHDPCPAYDPHRRRLFLRRTGKAIIDRDLQWLHKHIDEIKTHCGTQYGWILATIHKIFDADEMLKQAASQPELHAATYRMAVATYRRKGRHFDFHYDCYRRLRDLRPLLDESETELLAKTLFTMATALQKAHDSGHRRTYYPYNQYNLGGTWFSRAEIGEAGHRSVPLLQIARLYKELADICPQSPLADDALFWAAYNHHLYAKQCWTATRRKKKQLHLKKKADLLARLIKDYPDGDFAAKARDPAW